MRAALALAMVCLGAGCARQAYPTRPIVDDVEIQGADSEDAERIEAGLATSESPKTLGIWDGLTHDYETFDRSVLQNDLERVTRYYRARGYYEAEVTASRVVQVDPHRVRVEIDVKPGVPVITRHIQLTGIERIGIEDATVTLKAIDIEEGKPFDEDKFEQSKERITTALANRGYAFAKVDGTAHVDVANHEARVKFDVRPGRQARFGPITIVGLEEIPEEPVRDALKLEEGDPYSRGDLEEARHAVFDLGVFSRVVIDQDLERESDGVVPITLRVTESSLRSLSPGIGARIDVLRTTAYASVGWEHKNFLGGLRRLSITDKPGVTAFPTRIDLLTPPTRALFENRADVELRQPSFLEGRTTGWARSRYSVYPVLFPLADNVNPHDEAIIGYHEIGAATGLDRSFFGRLLPATLSYNWQANLPRSYQAPSGNDLINQLENVYVSYPELIVALDLRDDPVEPTEGIHASTSLQLANPLLGGNVHDVRVKPELRTFYPLSKKHGVVLATRVKFGFVFPRNYGFTFEKGRITDVYDAIDNPDRRVTNDQQKILFRAFYSGGPTSNRGYGYREVGPHGPISFLVPQLKNQDCVLDAARDPLPAACLRPLGGFSLWEASMEIRFPIVEPLSGTIFVDSSDVSTEIAYVAFGSPHLSVGPGLRYNTPIGPIRLDVGYRIPGWQVRGGGAENDKTYYPDIANIREFKNKPPFAYHIAIGEAF